MVKAVDIEGLMQRYMEENSLEKADALYLLATMDKIEAAEILTIRYGVAGALSPVLEDLKDLGVKDLYVETEDTGESFKSVVKRSFESIFLRKVLESARQRARDLSRNARELLYIFSLLPHESMEVEDIPRLYRVAFKKSIDRPTIEKALKELVRCYVVQRFSEYGYGHRIYFPPYIDDVLEALRDFIPEVRVEVLWPETRMKDLESNYQTS